MSLAKEKGRNRVQIYQSDDVQLIHHAEEMAAIHEVSNALQDNRLVLYRHKIKALSSQESSHFEILVRMMSPKGVLIAPNNFIPAAENMALFVKLITGLLKILGPIIVGMPYNAGSRALWPPFCAKLPPTKAIFANW